MYQEHSVFGGQKVVSEYSISVRPSRNFVVIKFISRCNRFSPLDCTPKFRPFNPHNRDLTPHVCVCVCVCVMLVFVASLTLKHSEVLSPPDAVSSCQHVVAIQERSSAMEFAVVHKTRHPRVAVNSCRASPDDPNFLVYHPTLC